VLINAGGELHTVLATKDDTERKAWAHEYLRLHVFVRPQRTDPDDLLRLTAELRLVGYLYSRVDSDDYSLAEAVEIILVRKQ